MLGRRRTLFWAGKLMARRSAGGPFEATAAGERSRVIQQRTLGVR